MKRSQLVLDASARLAMEPAAAPERYPSLQAGARAQLGYLFQQVMQREARAIVRRSRPRTNTALLRRLEESLVRAQHIRSHA